MASSFFLVLSPLPWRSKERVPLTFPFPDAWVGESLPLEIFKGLRTTVDRGAEAGAKIPLPIIRRPAPWEGKMFGGYPLDYDSEAMGWAADYPYPADCEEEGEEASYPYPADCEEEGEEASYPYPADCEEASSRPEYALRAERDSSSATVVGEEAPSPPREPTEDTFHVHITLTLPPRKGLHVSVTLNFQDISH